MRISILVTILTSLLIGCSRDNPEPEKLDPVLTALSSHLEGTKKDLEDAITKREDLESQIDKGEPNTIELKLARRDWQKVCGQIDELRQTLTYEELKVSRRAAEDRMNYRLSRKAKTEWPVKSEYRDYIAHQHLIDAPRSWNARVPKLADRVPSSVQQVESPMSPKEETKKE